MIKSTHCHVHCNTIQIFLRDVPVVNSMTYKSFACSSSYDYWCIYIYIYSHPQTDCFVLSELFSVARHAGRSEPGSKPSNFTLDCDSDQSSTKRTTLAKGILRYFYFSAAAAFVYIFYTLSATRVLKVVKKVLILTERSA